ncbi:MAG: two-component regulator propeller domain-containing protein, partial [Spirochaetaceae bacterium]|nr:two-component regulator propeller domain-containing protein [Spirochaetaceae bacterium]
MNRAICILLLGLGALPAASVGIGPGDMTWRRLGEEKGFFGGSVSSILQDRKGIIWIGASGGLFRYDGSVFKAYKPQAGVGGLASSSVSSIVEDERGELWVGTDGAGLFRHRPAEGRFERVDLGKDQGSRAALSRISALTAGASGRILVGTASGRLFFGDRGNAGFSPLEEPGESDQPITAILVDSKGRIWAGSDGGGLARYDSEGGLEARYRHDPESSDSIGSNNVQKLLEDSLGFLWIGLGEGGVDLVAEAGFKHARGNRSSSSALPRLCSLAEDPRGQIWMGFAGGGMGLLDPSSMEIRRESFADGIEVRVLHRDRRGLIWAGLERGGFLTGDLRSAGFERFTATLAGGRLGEIKAMALSAGGRVYACTSEGFIVVLEAGGGGFRRVESRLAELDPGAARTMLGAGDGSLWIGGTMPGLGRLDRDGRWRWYPLSSVPGEEISAVLSLHEDGGGRLLVGTEGGGAAIFDPADGSLRRLGLAGTDGRNPGWAITSLLKDRDGRIWAGSADSGLSFLDQARGEWTAPPDSREAIGDLRIEALFLDSRGELVIGTGGAGLAAIDPATGRILYRGTEAGLAVDSIRSIVEDRGGILWISSARGLYSLDPERKSSYLFGPEDGLCPGSIGAGALLLDGEGRVLAASGTGLARFDPLRAPRYAPAPEVVISEIAVAGAELSLLAMGEGSSIVLAYDNPGLRFGIAVVDYLAPERNRYAMMLEGRNRA